MLTASAGMSKRAHIWAYGGMSIKIRAHICAYGNRTSNLECVFALKRRKGLMVIR